MDCIKKKKEIMNSRIPYPGDLILYGTEKLRVVGVYVVTKGKKNHPVILVSTNDHCAMAISINWSGGEIGTGQPKSIKILRSPFKTIIGGMQKCKTCKKGSGKECFKCSGFRNARMNSGIIPSLTKLPGLGDGIVGSKIENMDIYNIRRAVGDMSDEEFTTYFSNTFPECFEIRLEGGRRLKGEMALSWMKNIGGKGGDI
jgi:hypothetical protein